MTYVYSKIAPEQMPQVWASVKPILQLAIDTSRGEASAEHFRRTIVKGGMDLFVASEDRVVVAAMVTQFVQHANYTALRVCLLGGTSDGVLGTAIAEFWPGLIDWSKSHGATKWEAFCHPGMARLLRRHGFTERYAMVVKNLGD